MDQSLRPSEVRRQVLSEHNGIRQVMARLDDVAKQALEQKGESGAFELRELGKKLLMLLGRQLSLEKERLVPTLFHIDAWGKERVRHLRQEHRIKSEAMRYFEGKLHSAFLTPLELAIEVEAFLDWLKDDIKLEEQDVLQETLLRDDSIQTDTFTG